MKELYKILNLSENATPEEIQSAYETLKKQYSEDRFLDGEQGNLAAKKLTELEQAYKDYLKNKQEQADSTTEDKIAQAYDYLKKGDFVNAQYVLDSFDNRDHEWHYLQSVVFYKKKWYNESKKQLEIAISMKPDEQKYKDDYENLKSFMLNGNGAYASQPQYQRNTQSEQQMGGSGCMESCCQCLACNAMLNCCCHG